MDESAAKPVMTTPLRVGVAGLGVAAGQVLPAFTEGAPFALSGGADVRAEARAAFTERTGKPAFDCLFVIICDPRH